MPGNKKQARMDVRTMVKEKKLKRMAMYKSKSGKGVYMVSPNGKQNVFAQLETLKEFCEGKRNTVYFSVANRDERVQSEIDEWEGDRT